MRWTSQGGLVGLKDFRCRACGKISHNVDKEGRLRFPNFCPNCGTEAPYQLTSRTAIFAAVASVLVLMFALFWFGRT
jgi:hypothetical protein